MPLPLPDPQLPSDPGDALQSIQRNFEAVGQQLAQPKQNDLEILSVKMFGALGDGVADDTGPIQQAIDATEALGGGRVYLPQGTYRTTDTLTIDSNMTVLQGAGAANHNNAPSGGTLILADFTGGAVIRIKAESCGVRELMITASNTRQAGAATDHGIHVEANDTSAGLATIRTLIERVRVTQQPGIGVLFVNNIVCSRLDMVDVDNCESHAIAILGGSYTGRTHKTRPGQIDIFNCRASRCGGHGLLVGQLDEDTNNDIPYRAIIINFESFFNVTNASTRLSLHELIVSGENHTIIGSASTGWNTSFTQTHTPLLLQGRHISLSSFRAIAGLNAALEVDDHPLLGTYDVRVEQLYWANPGSNYDPAVVIDNGCRNVLVSVLGNTQGYDSLATESIYTVAVDADRTIDSRFSFVRQLNSPTGLNSNGTAAISIADDDLKSIDFSDEAYGLLVISSNLANRGQALVAFRVGNASAFASVIASSGATVTALAASGSAFSGTSGSDGHLSIGPRTDANTLSVINRTGATAVYYYTLLNVNYPVTAGVMA